MANLETKGRVKTWPQPRPAQAKRASPLKSSGSLLEMPCTSHLFPVDEEAAEPVPCFDDLLLLGEGTAHGSAAAAAAAAGSTIDQTAQGANRPQALAPENSARELIHKLSIVRKRYSPEILGSILQESDRHWWLERDRFYAEQGLENLLGPLPCSTYRGRLRVQGKSEEVAAVKQVDLFCLQNKHLEPRQLVARMRKIIDLKHPNICKVHGVYMADVVRPVIVREYVEAGSIADWILAQKGKNRGWSIKKVPRFVRWLEDISQAMLYLHSQDLAHGNLSTRNCLLSQDLWTVRVSDTALNCHSCAQPQDPMGEDVLAYGLILHQIGAFNVIERTCPVRSVGQGTGEGAKQAVSPAKERLGKTAVPDASLLLHWPMVQMLYVDIMSGGMDSADVAMRVRAELVIDMSVLKKKSAGCLPFAKSMSKSFK